LLDAAFGFLVWAIHLVVIYSTTAIWCRFGLSGGTLLVLLVALTAGAAAIVLQHGVRRFRRDRAVNERRFRLSLTVGIDAIATFAILLQILAIALIPACS
jgi:hypothetical protein